MSIFDKRKQTAATRTPPPMSRFKTTDFRNAAEFHSFFVMGPMPNSFDRDGEFDLDKQFYSLELATIGISGKDYRKAMRLFRRDVRP